MTRFLLAGGGTAGHVNPLLALADAIVADNSENKVWALGTKEGLEANLVPQRGYELLTVDRLPFPRKPSLYALTFPLRFFRAVKQVKSYIKGNQIDVVVGFGGYASAPAYLAAKSLRIPSIVHEANALPGWANKLGAKSAKAVGITFKSTPMPNATFVGMPLRKEIEAIANGADKEAARLHFGLDPDTITLLVTGGSLGAKRINETIEDSRRLLSAAGIQVLHIMGGRSELPEVREKDYVRIAYCDRMDLAIAASSFAVSRAGASTVSEFAAVGLPAAYVPYPVGNGEQKLNVQDVVSGEGGLMVLDADFSTNYVAETLIPMISNSRALSEMAKKAKRSGVSDGTARLLTLVKGVL
jgi:UDP-N-acetylglucosamine--N-acetylmuramyl-(pentapeptide) pyrophosphoryl-undecaprenol N-acetylglucosamine transferase